ncbi:MAG: lysophospholipid acyltransferase family protein [bacterium]|nr:lysophospholipid acyltransferase family protein [bacterium]
MTTARTRDCTMLRAVKRIGWRLQYLLMRLAEALVQSLPPPAAQRVGDVAGDVWWAVDRRRRKRASENLRVAYPELPPAERQALVRACFRSMARVPVETMFAERLLPDWEAILRRCVIEGDLDRLRRHAQAGEAIMVVTGHLGNWELAARFLRLLGADLAVVARPIDNPLIDAHIVKQRGGPGTVIRHHGALARVREALRGGRMAALVGDQNAGRRGMFVPFFGLPASTYGAPGWMALREDVPLMVGTCTRQPGHDYRFRICFTFESLPPDAGRRGAIERLTALTMQRLEERVREAPEQYNWLHRRWKDRPPGEDPATDRPRYDHHRPRPAAEPRDVDAPASATPGRPPS